jgi:hypothetical protein
MFKVVEEEKAVEIDLIVHILKTSYKKNQWRPPSKKKKRGENPSPRNRKACHSVSTDDIGFRV